MTAWSSSKGLIATIAVLSVAIWIYFEVSNQHLEAPDTFVIVAVVAAGVTGAREIFNRVFEARRRGQ